MSADAMSRYKHSLFSSKAFDPLLQSFEFRMSGKDSSESKSADVFASSLIPEDQDPDAFADPPDPTGPKSISEDEAVTPDADHPQHVSIGSLPPLVGSAAGAAILIEERGGPERVTVSVSRPTNPKEVSRCPSDPPANPGPFSFPMGREARSQPDVPHVSHLSPGASSLGSSSSAAYARLVDADDQEPRPQRTHGAAAGDAGSASGGVADSGTAVCGFSCLRRCLRTSLEHCLSVRCCPGQGSPHCLVRWGLPLLLILAIAAIASTIIVVAGTTRRERIVFCQSQLGLSESTCRGGPRASILLFPPHRDIILTPQMLGNFTGAEVIHADSEHSPPAPVRMPLFLAVFGHVFDVSAGPQHYGRGAAYHNLTGYESATKERT